MFKSNRYVLALLLIAALPLSSHAQDVGRVMPACLPLPLPAIAPMPPDKLRADNPWNMTMTGSWKFALTHGKIVAGDFQPAAPQSSFAAASTSEDGHSPADAFDGDLSSRWCADSNSFPQWISADLGKVQHVSSIAITWENAGSQYEFRIDGSVDHKNWTTLADETSAPGYGSGPVPISAGSYRFVRVFVTGAPAGQWASISEIQIHYTDMSGQDTLWQAPPAASADSSEQALNAFAQPGFDDSTWDTISIPSNWEILGYSLPTYGSVDNTVGQYRRVVTIPADWAGKKIYWRFDGALDGAEIYVNGVKAGYHESGYTAFDVDLTGLVQPGKPNLFAVRVSKTTPSDDCETGDFQCMGGIYRETSLIAVPLTHVSDITVQTPLTNNYRDATLMATVKVAAAPGQSVQISGSLVRVGGMPTGIHVSGMSVADTTGNASVSLTAPVKTPALWSAEKPNLYYLVMQLSSAGQPVERVEQRFGFREVDIVNNVVLWNGVPIKCEGVCRHDFWADKGFALTEADWEKDLTLMKAANINAIRTSHYNHASRFLELCEEKGMYILDEVPFCWIGDSVKDPAYTPYLIQRASETLARDKNRPCVLAWSIGNENPYGQDEQDVFDYVRESDPTRPAFVSCMTPDQIKGQEWQDGHYPGPDDVDSDAKNTGRTYNFSEHPHIFYQEETQNYDPGASDLWSEALISTWQKIWAAPNILGSFIWEWQNQGIADQNLDRTSQFYYGLDHLRQENNKGIVDAYRNPKQEYWIVKQVYSPVVVGTRTINPTGGSAIVPLANRYSFTDLSEVTTKWIAYNGTVVLGSGVTHVSCPPLQSVQATFPAPAGITKLRLEFDHADGSEIVAANLTVAGAPDPAPIPAMAPGNALTAHETPDTLTVTNSTESIVFDKHSGTVASWEANGRTLLTGGPEVNLGELKASTQKTAYESTAPPITQGANVTAAPADANGNVLVTVASTVIGEPDGAPLGALTTNYNIQQDDEITVSWSLTWTAPSIWLWETGLKLTTPPTLNRISWLRDSYFTDYPVGHVGEPSGHATATDVSFRASKRNLHWLTLTDSTNNGIELLPVERVPLIARANSTSAGTTLFASSQVAGPWDFSGAWTSAQTTHAVTNQTLTGAFTLRAIGQ